MLESHPYANIFRMATPEEYAGLRTDIEKNGVNHPIVLFEGKILDGRNRYKACMELGISPPLEMFNGLDALQFVISENLHRRHLDATEKAFAGVEIKRIEAERALARKREAGGDHGNQYTGSKVAVVEKIPQAAEQGKARDFAAKAVGVNGKYIDAAEKLVKEAPVLAQAAKSGAMNITTASALSALPVEAQEAAVVAPKTVLVESAKVLTETRREANEQAREMDLPKKEAAEFVETKVAEEGKVIGEMIARGEQEILAAAKRIRVERAAIRREENEKLKQEVPVIPNGKYRTIVIDPPWDMAKIDRDVRDKQVGFDYPVMTEGELAEFRLDEMADDDCHLFCWTTHKHLPMALRLIDVWGFRYVFTMVWHKSGGFQPFGLAQYNCEFVLYARRGTPSFVDTKNFFCCFNAPRREHSRKPDEFYETVKRVTDGPRIDVFARQAREGFDVFGNEAGKFQ